MSNLNEDARINIAAAIDKALKAEERLLAAVHLYMPDGTEVTWLHGENRRTGKIINRKGICLDDLEFRIESPSGAKYWISAKSVFTLEGIV